MSSQHGRNFSQVSVDNTELDFDRLLVKQRAAQTLKARIGGHPEFHREAA